jgi:hypothetical protein
MMPIDKTSPDIGCRKEVLFEKLQFHQFLSNNFSILFYND